MSEPKRYFINNLPDEASIDIEVHKGRIESLVKTVIQNLQPVPQVRKIS